MPRGQDRKGKLNLDQTLYAHTRHSHTHTHFLKFGEFNYLLFIVNITHFPGFKLKPSQ